MILRNKLMLLVLTLSMAMTGWADSDLHNLTIISKFDTLFSYSKAHSPQESGASAVKSEADRSATREHFLDVIRGTLDEILRTAENDRVLVYCNFAIAMHIRQLSEVEFQATWLVHSQLRQHLGVEPIDILRAGVLLLESDQNDDQKAGYTCLDAALGASVDTPDLLLDFLSSQRAEGTTPSAALMDFMIQRDMNSAVADFRKLFETKGERDEELLGFQRLITTALTLEYGGTEQESKSAYVVDELRAHANDADWWVRLCVAELMRRFPEVQNSEIVEQLRADSNLRVRETIACLEVWEEQTKSPPKYRIQVPGLVASD